MEIFCWNNLKGKFVKNNKKELKEKIPAKLVTRKFSNKFLNIGNVSAMVLMKKLQQFQKEIIIHSSWKCLWYAFHLRGIAFVFKN